MLGFGVDSISSLDFSGTPDSFPHARILSPPLLANDLMVNSLLLSYLFEKYLLYPSCVQLSIQRAWGLGRSKWQEEWRRVDGWTWGVLRG